MSTEYYYGSHSNVTILSAPAKTTHLESVISTASDNRDKPRDPEEISKYSYKVNFDHYYIE